MKLKIKLVYLSILILVMFSISGCQLANGEKEDRANVEKEEADRLMGMYIMIDDLNSTEDDFKELEETEKIYAELVETEDDGVRSVEYAFKGYNGIPFYSYNVSEEVSKSFGLGSEFRGDVSGAEICDASIGYNSNWDNESEDITSVDTTLEGKLFFAGECIAYGFPVYQEDDGDVYFIPNAVGQYIDDLGVLTEKNIWEKDDEGATTVEISYEMKGIADKVDIIYMNSNDEIIEKDTYEQGQVPEKIEVPEETELIIVKSRYNGEEEIQVDVYTKEDTMMKTLVYTGNIVLCSETTELIWND